MTAFCLSMDLPSPDATQALAARIGAALRPGDCILLEGPIGAGKTHFARQLIWSLQDAPEDVPSPTFTLVQTYDTRAGPVWHADLYRLTGPDEIEELGLADAFDTAICLVEWPDRLGTDAPETALHLSLAHDRADADLRHATLSWTAPKWNRLMELNDDL